MAKVVNLVNSVQSGGSVDLSGLQTQIDQCNAKIDEQSTTLTQKINTAQSTADSAASTANTAYSTASSAASTASTAYQTANNAVTAASSKGNCKLTSFTYTGTNSYTHSIALPSNCYMAVVSSPTEYGSEFTVIIYGVNYWFSQGTNGASGYTASWSGRTITINGRNATPVTNKAELKQVFCYSA